MEPRSHATHLKDEIASMMLVLSDADDFWFVVNPESHYHGFSLCSRLGMTKWDYEALLIAAELGRIMAGKFVLLHKNWEAFIHGAHFVFLDGTKKSRFLPKKVHLESLADDTPYDKKKARQYYCVRIGGRDGSTQNESLMEQVDRNGKLLQMPPQFTSLRSKQHEFGRTVMPTIMKAVYDDNKLFDFFMVDDNEQQLPHKHKANNAKTINHDTHTMFSPQPSKKSKATTTPSPQSYTTAIMSGAVMPTPSPQQMESQRKDVRREHGGK